jgi:hypothetical protein
MKDEKIQKRREVEKRLKRKENRIEKQTQLASMNPDRRRLGRASPAPVLSAPPPPSRVMLSPLDTPSPLPAPKRRLLLARRRKLPPDDDAASTPPLPCPVHKAVISHHHQSLTLSHLCKEERKQKLLQKRIREKRENTKSGLL